MPSLYERTSITPAQLITAAQEVAKRWPKARLHKNDTTKNLSVEVRGEYIAMIDLLDGSVVSFEE